VLSTELVVSGEVKFITEISMTRGCWMFSPHDVCSNGLCGNSTVDCIFVWQTDTKMFIKLYNNVTWIEVHTMLMYFTLGLLYIMNAKLNIVANNTPPLSLVYWLLVCAIHYNDCLFIYSGALITAMMSRLQMNVLLKCFLFSLFFPQCTCSSHACKEHI